MTYTFYKRVPLIESFYCKKTYFLLRFYSDSCIFEDFISFFVIGTTKTTLLNYYYIILYLDINLRTLIEQLKSIL